MARIREGRYDAVPFPPRDASGVVEVKVSEDHIGYILRPNPQGREVMEKHMLSL